MPGRSLDALDLDNQPLDDRWTLSKLAAAGYQHTGTRKCRSCGESVEFYVREPANGGKLWLVLDEAGLTPHRCGGSR